MPLRKQYVLVSSDDRTPHSVSTTDFSVLLREPINNVVKTDLVNVSMDYNMANIVSPNNTFSVSTYQEITAAVAEIPAYDEVIPAVVGGWYYRAAGGSTYSPLVDYARTEAVGHYNPRTGEAAGDYWFRESADPQNIHHNAVPAVPAVYGGVSQTYAIDEEQYTPTELRAALEELLGGAEGYFDVFLINRNLRIEYWFPTLTTSADERTFTFTCSNATLKATLGMTGNTLTGTYVPTIGDHGGSRITFPRAIRLPANNPFIMIQSKELGITTKTSSGLGFWRALINDPSQDQLIATNQRTDDYHETPRRLQEIDIKLGFPDGKSVNNRGSAFAVLIEVITNDEVKQPT